MNDFKTLPSSLITGIKKGGKKSPNSKKFYGSGLLFIFGFISFSYSIRNREAQSMKKSH